MDLMGYPNSSRRAACALLASLAIAPAWSAPDSYPNGPVKWVVGFPPGGGTDVLARTVAARLGEQFHQVVNVENRPGAGGMLAAEYVAAATPDGYTVLTGDIAIMVFNSALYSKVRYDAQKDFVPVGLMARFPMIIATNPSSGFTTMNQFIDAARKGDARATYASAGIGTPHHLAMEMLLSNAGTKASHVPYRGDAPALQDVAAGQVPVAVLAPSLTLPYLRTNKLRALAVTSETRMPQLPDVPTLKELGLATVGVYAWQGMVMPRNTPIATVMRMTRDMQTALAQPDVRQKLSDLGMEVTPSDGPTMAAHITSERAIWDPLIKARNIKSD